MKSDLVDLAAGILKVRHDANFLYRKFREAIEDDKERDTVLREHAADFHCMQLVLSSLLAEVDTAERAEMQRQFAVDDCIHCGHGASRHELVREPRGQRRIVCVDRYGYETP